MVAPKSKSLRLAVTLAALAVACSRGPAPAPAPPDGGQDAAVAAEAGLATDAGADADAGPSATESAACPPGTILVDGDYCTALELTCKKSWYAKWNDKTICEEFESPSKCVGNLVHKRFCIDEYEYPNKKGQRPRVMFKFPEAQRLCAAEGKRVCTETEWTTACEGPQHKPYPYGYERDPQACNGDRQYVEPKVVDHDHKGLPIFAFASRREDVSRPELERLWQGVESGSQPRCVSDYGVRDMPGNADELAASETPEPTSKFDNVTTGGPWLYGVRNQCRPKIYTHNEGFSYYYLSTRCCVEADGRPTDPRAPKQIQRKERWRP